MLAEWDRVLNHLMFTGSFPLELGAITPMFYAFIERELIQGVMESATGSRMHYSYVRPGGLRDDLPRGWLKQSAEVLKQIRRKLEDFENLVMGNEIVYARTRGIDVIPPETAISYGCSGPTLQGSGVPMDARKDEPYAMYGEVEFDVPVGRNGDSYDRLWVLNQRMHESCKIIEQCMDRLQPGAHIASKLRKSLKLEGEVYLRTENPLGLMGYYLVGNGKKEPYRLKMRTASFSNISVLPALLPGMLLPDLLATLGTIFYIVGDIDR